MGIAEFGFMLEHVQPTRQHFAACRRAIMLEHVFQRLPEKFQIIFAKARLLGEERRDEAMCDIDAVGNGVLAPMVRLSPCCFSASASVATAMRVIECSWAMIGSTERAKVEFTGPRT